MLLPRPSGSAPGELTAQGEVPKEQWGVQQTNRHRSGPRHGCERPGGPKEGRFQWWEHSGRAISGTWGVGGTVLLGGFFFFLTIPKDC